MSPNKTTRDPYSQDEDEDLDYDFWEDENAEDEETERATSSLGRLKRKGIWKRIGSTFYTVVAIVLIIMFLSSLFQLYEFYTDEGLKNKRSIPGDFYADYLGGDYNSILVEMDYVQGYAPDDQALEHFQEVLERESQKTVNFKVDDAIVTDQDTYSFKDIENLEDRYRDEFRGGNTAVMYFLYLNGSYTTGNVIGVAYHGSSIAIFIEQVRDAASLRIDGRELEQAVLVHETGHLFGLVEINYQSQHNHQDPENAHHCDHTDALGHHDCVMYFAIETTNAASFDSYYNQVVGDVPNDFCEYCKSDLQQQRQRAS